MSTVALRRPARTRGEKSSPPRGRRGRRRTRARARSVAASFPSRRTPMPAFRKRVHHNLVHRRDHAPVRRGARRRDERLWRVAGPSPASKSNPIWTRDAPGNGARGRRPRPRPRPRPGARTRRPPRPRAPRKRRGAGRRARRRPRDRPPRTPPRGRWRRRPRKRRGREGGTRARREARAAARRESRAAGRVSGIHAPRWARGRTTSTPSRDAPTPRARHSEERSDTERTRFSVLVRGRHSRTRRPSCWNARAPLHRCGDAVARPG